LYLYFPDTPRIESWLARKVGLLVSLQVKVVFDL
jgi:hypothetical protein